MSNSTPSVVTRMLNTVNSQFKIQYSTSNSANYAILIPPTSDTKATMNNPIITIMNNAFIRHGWNVIRFNYSDNNNQANLSVQMKALIETNFITDWYIKNVMTQSNNFIVCGYASGALVALELLMRRPEINAFMALALNGQSNNNTFLAPCPNPGLFIHGKYDKIACLDKAQETMKKLQTQQANIEMQILDDDHFFTKHRGDLLKQIINEFLENLENLDRHNINKEDLH